MCKIAMKKIIETKKKAILNFTAKFKWKFMVEAAGF
jgi:hypothetical protein